MTFGNLAFCTAAIIALGSASLVSPSFAQTDNSSPGEQAQTRELNLQQLQQNGGAQVTQNNGNGMSSPSSDPVDNSSATSPNSNSLNSGGNQTDPGSMNNQPNNQANPNCTSTTGAAAQNCPSPSDNGTNTSPHN